MIIYTATIQEWERIKGSSDFVSDNYTNEKFIHCSYPHQTVKVLNKHYFGEEKVLLLCINEKLLQSKLVIEDLKNKGEKFPHVYGAINIDSIEEVIEIKSNEDGSFTETTELDRLINS